MVKMPDIDMGRREILSLRARVVVLERMTLAALELALRIRPEELNAGIELARSRLSTDYEDASFAQDVSNEAERHFLSREVERLMRAVQADMGFRGGIASDPNG